jgi:superfamily II DNA/RNA helicase
VPETYVHRIGRTARAGAEGIAISLCDGEEMAFVRDIEKLIHVSIPMSDRRADQRRSQHASARGSSAAASADAGKRHWHRGDPARKHGRRHSSNGSAANGIDSVAFLHRAARRAGSPKGT